jgi:hypothetical protein
VPGLDPRRPRPPRRLRRLGLRSLGVVLTLCLAIMCSAAAVPSSAHAGTADPTCEAAGERGSQYLLGLDVVLNSLACGFYSVVDFLAVGAHDILFGASELLYEGVYGAGCGINNVLKWDGKSCDMSVADAGKVHRNFLNDWSDCIAAFDPTPFGLFAAVITAEDEAEIEAVVQTTATSGVTKESERLIADFMSSDGVTKVVADNARLVKSIARAIPFIDKALMLQAIGAACFADTVRSLEAIVWMDQQLHLACADNTTDEDRTQCKQDRFDSTRFVNGDTIAACLEGQSFNVVDEAMGSKLIDGEDARSMCEKVILPEARDRGMLDDDELGVVNGLLPAAQPIAKELQPSAVPGGSTADTCGLILRAIAAGNGGSFTSDKRRECAGIDDDECQMFRARQAVGNQMQFTSREASAAMTRRCM